MTIPEFERLRSVHVLYSSLTNGSECLVAVEDEDEIPEMIAHWEGNGWEVQSLSSSRFWMTKPRGQ